MRNLRTRVADQRVIQDPDPASAVLATLPAGYEVRDQQPPIAPPVGWLRVETEHPATGARVVGFMQDQDLEVVTPKWQRLAMIGAGVLALLLTAGLFFAFGRGTAPPSGPGPTQVVTQVVIQTTTAGAPIVHTVEVQITTTPAAATRTPSGPVRTATGLAPTRTPRPTRTPNPTRTPIATAGPQGTAAPAGPTSTPPPQGYFPASPQEVVTLFNLRDKDLQPLSETHVVACPDGEGGVESMCWEVKVSPLYIDNPYGYWLEGFRQNPGVRRPGGYTHPELSGVPPYVKDELLDSGVTVRSETDYNVAPTPGPLDWDTFLDSVEIPGFPTMPREAAEFYNIDMAKSYPYAGGENHAIIIRPLAPNKFFTVENGDCWMDGYRTVSGEVRQGFEREADAGKISVPPHYQGQVVEFVIRPCEADQEAMLATSGGSTPVPSITTGFPTTSDDVETMFQISNGVVAGCSGEINCWQVSPVTAGGFFQISNVTTCWQNGYTRNPHEMRSGQSDPKTSIPAGFSGEAEAAQLRPCTANP